MDKIYIVTATLIDADGTTEAASRQCEENFADYDDMLAEAVDEARDRYANMSPSTVATRILVTKFILPIPRDSVTVASGEFSQEGDSTANVIIS
jgi:hypothetical protein